MITVACVSTDSTSYLRGIVTASINTVTESDDGLTWIKFWDGQKPVNVKVNNSVADVYRKIFIATHGKAPAATCV
jgi:hypothetical protein